ncbi:Acetolactate synthase (plasmid) [Variovorax sp. SRS16]|uniref:thiamine pyrophosphate-binding protein n=1 Tax=Variovorax sp. SRS16 TaxID=282217 RepID=UPI001316C925|nr:thiamine pyrophosphate-binding protein [Variovorax sp. SRS16]VTU45617.1 Acetolactate synthase [Variovorax sp. SRS16]
MLTLTKEAGATAVPAHPVLVIDVLAQRLAARGVKRFFGVPGGDCSLDLISACAKVGIEFILARTESAAGMMASVTGEITGAPGVIMVTRGPGLAHAMNGVAYAALDRAPLLVLADGYDAPRMDAVAHQRYDQHAMIAPLAKGSCNLAGRDPGRDIDALLDLASADPPGPVYIEMRGGEIRREAEAVSEPAPRAVRKAAPVQLSDKARELLSAAQRPIIIAGLQASDAAASAALRKLMKAWNCPVLETYKSLGTVSADEPMAVGCYTAGAADAVLLQQADLVLLYGLDAIEFPAHKWLYNGPIIEFTSHDFPRNIVKPEVTMTGPLAAFADAVAGVVRGTEWKAEVLAAARAELKQRARADKGDGPITPQALVDAVIAAAPAHARIALDAGAHMLPVLHAWHATEPRQSLISRGLATMAFALPAAIGSALAQPERPVIAFTGDGGLMMCAGELGTAVQYGCKLVVVVFNDESLTLIEVKQRQRKFERDGLDFSPANFAKVAEGFGCLGLRVERPEELAPAMQRAFAHDGPVLIDTVVNPHAYTAQLAALRG